MFGLTPLSTTNACAPPPRNRHLWLRMLALVTDVKNQESSPAGVGSIML